MFAFDDLKPMLLNERPFDRQQRGWPYEIMFNGDRPLAGFDQGKCLLKPRDDANAATWLPEITRPLANIRLFPEDPYVVDGEVCVIDDMGRSDFDRLHVRAKRRSFYGGCDPVTFCVFDLQLANGVTQTSMPYFERKKRLQRLFKPAPAGVLHAGHFESDGELLFHGVLLQLQLEGQVARRADSIYEPDVRSLDWVKVRRRGVVPAQRFRTTSRTFKPC